MGHWDYHAVELFAEETPKQVLACLPATHGFHVNGAFPYEGIHWVHLGWNDANAVAYRALVTFCQQTGRRWITSYATDPQAFLDDRFFGPYSPERDQRLTAVFGPSEAQRAGVERDPPLSTEYQ
jgi:hypothetical protein